ncbi:MAG: isoprenylcysteine carboxylmethyltransferase family protein [Ignavibacteriae bacterium]|nr:isoprenylcysteine carboxylmethyltransferase family protein [Ignavibacteriota bacterium]
MSLTDKYINSIFKIATGGKLIRNVMTPVGFIIFVSFVTGLIFLSLYLDKIFEYSDFISFPFDLIFGFLFLFPGIILTGSCVIYFLKNKGTPVPFNPPPKLISDGPYAYSRNPMITGLFFILFGVGFICNSVTLTFIITPLFILLNIIELKNIEEPELEKRLGNEYLEYKKSVPMFFPKIRKNN